MLDVKFIRENADLVKKVVKNKQLDKTVDVDKFLEVGKKFVDLLQNVETHRALRNQLSSNISKVGEKEREKMIKEASKVKEELKKMEEELVGVEEERNALLKLIPNIVSEDTPVGNDDSGNKVLRKHGDPKKFNFDTRDHVDLGEELGIINTERSAKVSGTRFAYLTGDAAMLQFALIQFVLDAATDEKVISKIAKKAGSKYKNPFIPVVPPMMVREEVMDKMDRLEPKEDRYILEKDGLVLVGSAEHTMGPMHMEETLDLSEGPKRYIGYSTAFRREAGSYGKDTRGILRLHQFDKLEFESFSSPEDGLAEQGLLVGLQEYMLQKLEIPYRVVAICTGDMGKPDFRQIDMECYMPGQRGYIETHTSDYMTDFQSRRLRIKSKSGGLVHMNDATAMAIGRMLIAILENNQNEDGSVDVPKVLRKYVGKRVIKKS